MAQEQRHETLFASGTTDADAIVEFRNDSAGMIHIRGLDMDLIQSAGENDEFVHVELSKAPTFQGATTGSPFFRMGLTSGISGGTTGAAVDDVAFAKNKTRRWGRGQLTLEPNESLFLNREVTGGSNAQSTNVIEYEFA